MIVNRIISSIKYNNLVTKNLYFSQNYLIQNKTDNKCNVVYKRCHSEITANKEKKLNLPEMNKSLKKMEENVEISFRQSNYKLGNTNFLKESEKKLSNKFYNTYIDPYIKLMRWNNLAPVHLVFWPGFEF
jgi:hypothetical protein